MKFSFQKTRVGTEKQELLLGLREGEEEDFFHSKLISSRYLDIHCIFCIRISSQQVDESKVCWCHFVTKIFGNLFFPGEQLHFWSLRFYQPADEMGERELSHSLFKFSLNWMLFQAVGSSLTVKDQYRQMLVGLFVPSKSSTSTLSSSLSTSYSSSTCTSTSHPALLHLNAPLVQWITAVVSHRVETLQAT